MAHESWVGQSLESFTPGGATNYASFASCYDLGDETSAQVISPAGVYSMASVFVQSSSGTATITFRKNGSNGSQVISIGSSLTGWFQDTTHTDTVSNGDSVCLQVVTSSGVTLAGAITCMFTPSGGTAVGYYGQGNVRGPNGSAGTWYNWLAGIAQSNSLIEAQVQTVWRAAGTFSGLSMFPNSGSQQPSVNFRNTGVTGNQVLTAGGSGARQTDTTHTDTVASGDKIALLTGSNDRWSSVYMRFTSSDDHYEILCGNMGGVNNGSHYFSVFGETSSPGTTESRVQAKVPIGITLSKLRINVSLNVALNGTTTFNSRINGSSGNLTVAVPFGTTGFFEDTTHSDTLTAGDLFNSIAVGTQTSGSVQGNVSYLAITGSGPATITGVTTSTLTGISQTINANLVQSAGVTTRLTGISQLISAKQTNNAAVITRLVGISQRIIAADLKAPGTGRRQFWTS